MEKCGLDSFFVSSVTRWVFFKVLFYSNMEFLKKCYGFFESLQTVSAVMEYL